MIYTIKEKQSIVSLLDKMMRIDGYCDNQERDLLKRIKNILNLPIYDEGPLVDFDTALSVVGAMNNDKKMEVAAMLQQMILADGLQDSSEMYLFGQIVTSAGIDKAIERKTSEMNIPQPDDALIYCRSSKVALSGRSPEFLSAMNSQALEFKNFFSYNPSSLNDICDVIVNMSMDSVRNSGWDINDVDGASWFIANFTDAMIKAGLVHDYDLVFTKCFKLYFNRI